MILVELNGHGLITYNSGSDQSYMAVNRLNDYADAYPNFRIKEVAVVRAYGPELYRHRRVCS